jgi:hypothetical protein
MRLLLRILLIAAALGCLLAASARADTAQSSNWAGYAAHRAGIRFNNVVAHWTQPRASCERGRRTYSAVWVGLGGFNATSEALEQIGTEVDCTASGRVVSSAWYELVPAPSQSIRMSVRPGDQLSASVTVSGSRVSLVLSDSSTHRSFRKTLHATKIDVSSAEWIVEAPSACISVSICQTLQLANFGSATFSLAAARSVAGHSGSISDSQWDSTQIRLTPTGQHYVVLNGAPSVATPSALANGGRSFKVTFASVAARGNPLLRARQASLREGYIVHPRR